MPSKPTSLLPLRHTPALVGMVHLLPTPGSPRHTSMEKSLKWALRDAQVLLQAGFDAILLENMHDFPPLREKDIGPEIPAYLSVIAREVRALAPPEVPVGIQVLFAAHRVAVAVAHAATLDFIRAEAWTYGHLSDKGWVEASAASTVRYAQAIGARMPEVWADVKKKHAAHAATADLSIEEIAATLELHGASAVVITGRSTGLPPDPRDFQRVRPATSLPLVLGSGLTVQNAPHLAGLADAYIVGSSLKKDSKWWNPIEFDRAKAIVDALRSK